MLNLSYPISKQFRFKAVPTSIPGVWDIRRATDDEEPDATVSFRQGTNQEDDARTDLANRRKYRQAEDGTWEQVEDFNLKQLVKQDVFSTLCETSIRFPDEKETLKFVTVDGVTRVADYGQFERWWNLMRPQWKWVFYECCLEVNPDWDPKRAAPSRGEAQGA